MGLVDLAVKNGSSKDRKSGGSVTATGEPNRRRFLSWLWAGLSGVAVLELVWLTASYLKPASRLKEAGNAGRWFEAGPVDAFAPNSVSAFSRGRFYLVRLESGGFLALSRQCTHLGCTVPWNSDTERFECPCHASVFDIRGEVVRSPAQRALDIYPVVIENKRIRVDTGRIIERNTFRPEQVIFPP